MAFTIRSQNKVWVGDVRWRVYEHPPSARRLRADGRRLSARYFGRCTAAPDSVAFLDLDAKIAKKELHSLAVSMAAHFGPATYAECDIGGDQIWLVATDAGGRLLPGSDGIYTPASIRSEKQTLSGFAFRQSLTIDEVQLESIIGALNPAPLTLRSVSLGALYKRLSVAGSVAALVYLGHGAYERHRAALAQRAADDAARRNVKPAVEPSGPSEWVAACLSSASVQPLRAGWALASWSCEGGRLRLTWERHGGVLEDAPPGVIADSGNGVEQSLPLQPMAGHAGKPDEGDPIRDFLTLLQNAGIKPAIATSRRILPGIGRRQVINVVTLQFQWPSDPRLIDWNRFARLEIASMDRTLFAKDMTNQNTAFGIKATFAVAERGIQ
jgi:Pilin accessory protein (PilO)